MKFAREKERSMVKTLVSIDADLASSIALRTTCQLAKATDLDIQTLHIQEAATMGPATGAGWASRTWQRELVEEGRKEILPVLVAESGTCPVLKEPLVLSGDRDKEILKELEQGSYDLFVEGSPVPFSAKTLARRVDSRLYQQAPCPVLQVPNLLPLQQVLAIVRDAPGCRCVFAGLQRLFPKTNLEVDISLSSLREQDRATIQEDAVGKAAGEFGWAIRNSRSFQGEVESIVPTMRAYGLVVVAMARPVKGKNPLVEFLGQLAAPMLFCWR
jgi:hypothetical protein